MANYVNLFLFFLILSCAICQNTDGQLDLRLLNGFDANTVREDETLQLQCTVSDATVGSFQWKRTSGEMTDVLMDGTDGITIVHDINNGQPISTLTIANVRRSEEGSYQCVLIVNGGGEIQSSLDVNIAHLPAPQCFQSHSTVNGIATVLCTAEPAAPNMTIQWTDLTTGSIINGNKSFSEMEGLFILKLNSSRIPDGNITRLLCIVTNPAFPGSEKTCDFIMNTETTTKMATTKISTEATTQQTGKPSTAFATSAKFTSKVASSSSTTSKVATSLPITTNKVTSDSTNSNVTQGPLPKTGAVFGMTEIIIIAAIGGLIVLILLILGIYILVRLCRKPRQKDRDLGITYKTEDADIITETPARDGYVQDDVHTPEYFVMGALDTSKSPSKDDLSVLPALTAINKAKKEEKELNVSAVSLNLYDSVSIEDD